MKEITRMYKDQIKGLKSKLVVPQDVHEDSYQWGYNQAILDVLKLLS